VSAIFNSFSRWLPVLACVLRPQAKKTAQKQIIHGRSQRRIKDLFVAFVIFCELPVFPALPSRLCVFA
jgi:hypothetical protein